MTTSHLTLSRMRPAAGATTIIRKAFDAMLKWHDRSRARWDLLRLDDRMLSDVGLTRADVYREANKPLWRA
jgi:uncharacterized protein YjiS (DUF1127 family)